MICPVFISEHAITFDAYNTMTQTLILASSSPRRRALIASLGIDFRVIKPDIDETQRPGEHPVDYVTRLARTKAAAAAGMIDSDGTVLAADTVVILAADTIGADTTSFNEHTNTGRGDILGKPEDEHAARLLLERLRGRAHTVCTAFCLRRVDSDAGAITESMRTTVHMRDYSDDEIAAYIASGDPFDKAGGYAIQHAGFRPVARIDGCYNNVVGLPLCAVKYALHRFGWRGLDSSGECDCPPFATGLETP